MTIDGSLCWLCSLHPIRHIAMPEAGAIHSINGATMARSHPAAGLQDSGSWTQRFVMAGKRRLICRCLPRPTRSTAVRMWPQMSRPETPPKTRKPCQCASNRISRACNGQAGKKKTRLCDSLICAIRSRSIRRPPPQSPRSGRTGRHRRGQDAAAHRPCAPPSAVHAGGLLSTVAQRLPPGHTSR